MPDDHIDLHELRMSIGTNSMNLADAVADEDFLALMTDIREPFERAYQHLIDNGVSDAAAIAVMHGFCATAIDGARL